jgi:hypothetical protein
MHANKSGRAWQLTGKTRLQRVWVWNESVTAFVKERIRGYSLNVCAGQNPLCDVNLDLDPRDRRIIKGEMRMLPFAANQFDTVVSDPPWKISYYERFRPFFECVRVCKVGGRIIYNATWIPMTPSGDAHLEDVWIRQDANFTNVSVISIFCKIADNAPYEEAIERERAHHRAGATSHARTAVIDQRDQLWARVVHLSRERQQIAQVLHTFAESPVSLASVQPVLRLAEEINARHGRTTRSGRREASSPGTQGRTPDNERAHGRTGAIDG